MSWNGQDNKQYRGPIDQAFVSLTEPYEVAHFVDAYIGKRGAVVNDANRKVVRDMMFKYPGRAPIQRAALERYLDENVSGP